MKDNRLARAKTVCLLTGIFIVAVGIWLWVSEETTTGVLGGRSGTSPRTLTGSQVILAGIMFSVVSWLLFKYIRSDK